MVARALHHERRARVPYRKALACQAVYEATAAGCAIEGNVAHAHVLVELVCGISGRTHAYDAARQALAHVVVRIAFDVERYAPRQEGTKALAARSRAVYGYGAGGQALGMGLRDRGS